MTRIAHITDLHLVEHDYARRSAGERRRLQYLNTGRDIDPARRRHKAVDALRLAASADHVVITGDLTEDGSPAQFEAVAEVLTEAGVAPERVTLVPGNHDVYHSADAFGRALGGPLRRYAGASLPGAVVELGAALLVPICTAVAQNYLRSAGVLSRPDLERIGALARRKRTLIVAQHHPPLGHRNPIRNWIDGLCNVAASAALLMMHTHLQVHCAGAVLESGAHVRFYDADQDGFAPVPVEQHRG